MSLKVQDVMDALIEPAGPIAQTVDTLKFGDPQTEVTGIMTTFMPTQQVLEQAVERGVNLIVAHEGLFFNHHDSIKLQDDPVYIEKKRFIEAAGLAVFRFHDYVHRYRPDGIMEGLIEKLCWQPYVREHQAAATIVTIPQSTVRELGEYVKRKLGIPYVRIVGEPSMPCMNVGLLAGYRGGGANAIPLFEGENLDVILYGEGPEWETPEYVRDAVYQGRRKALLVLGHAESEASGMKLLASRLQARYPGIPVCYLEEEPIFQVI